MGRSASRSSRSSSRMFLRRRCGDARCRGPVVVDVLRDEDDGGGGVHEGGVQLRGRVGLTAHPRRLRASPVSHVTMNADMPGPAVAEVGVYLGARRSPKRGWRRGRARGETVANAARAVAEPRQVQRQPQSAGHSTRGETMAEKRTREEGRARASPTARANETDADSAAGKAAGVSRDLAGGAPCWAEIIHPSAGWSEEATHAERRTRV